tara:strand:+ start:11390 stop:11932 length:543 start_codon:yes stop_codon:yes gene_type:complete
MRGFASTDTGRLGALPELKVLRAVIVLAAILVVYLLVRFKVAVEHIFHDESVLKHIAVSWGRRMIGHPHLDVAVAHKPAALPLTVERPDTAVHVVPMQEHSSILGSRIARLCCFGQRPAAATRTPSVWLNAARGSSVATMGGTATGKMVLHEPSRLAFDIAEPLVRIRGYRSRLTTATFT